MSERVVRTVKDAAQDFFDRQKRRMAEGWVPPRHYHDMVDELRIGGVYVNRYVHAEKERETRKRDQRETRERPERDQRETRERRETRETERDQRDRERPERPMIDQR